MNHPNETASNYGLLLLLLFFLVCIGSVVFLSGWDARYLAVALSSILWAVLAQLVRDRFGFNYAVVAVPIIFALGAMIFQVWFLPLVGLAIMTVLWRRRAQFLSRFPTQSVLTGGAIVDFLGTGLFSIYIVSRFLLSDFDTVAAFALADRSVLDKDEGFFVSIATMILNNGVPSTGVDGTPFYPYHNLFPYLVAGVARITGYDPFEIYRFLIPMFVVPLCWHALTWLLEAIRAPRGTIGLFFLIILGAAPAGHLLGKPFEMWLSSPGLTLSFLFLTYFWIALSLGLSPKVNLLLTALATYSKVTTGAVLFVASTLLLGVSRLPLNQKIFFISMNVVLALALWFVTMSYWGIGNLTDEIQRYVDYVAPQIVRFNLFHIGYSPRGYSLFEFLVATIFLGPLLVLLGGMLGRRESRRKRLLDGLLISLTGACLVALMINVTYESAAIFGVMALALWPGVALVATGLAEVIQSVSFSGWRVGLNWHTVKQSLRFAIALTLLGWTGTWFVDQSVEASYKIGKRAELTETDVAATGKLWDYFEAFRRIRDQSRKGNWGVHVPASEKEYWYALNFSNGIDCIRMPFFIPMFTGMPSIWGFLPSCDQGVGVPLRGYTSYGYSAYLGSVRGSEICDEGWDGYFQVEREDGIATIKEIICSKR